MSGDQEVWGVPIQPQQQQSSTESSIWAKIKHWYLTLFVCCISLICLYSTEVFSSKNVEGSIRSFNQGIAFRHEARQGTSRHMVSPLCSIAFYVVVINAVMFMIWLCNIVAGLCRHFIATRVPELRMLNQNTFFSLSEITDSFQSKSACHIIYGDRKCHKS